MQFLDVKTDYAFRKLFTGHFPSSDGSVETCFGSDTSKDILISFLNALESQHKRKEFISIQKLALMKAKSDGIEQGLEKGREEGIEQGREEGIEQRNIEIAKNLLDILDDETISLKTGLEIEKIKFLR